MEITDESYSHDESVPLSPACPLNLVLIGVREAGKSASGNAILGTIAFDQVGVRTRTSVRQEGLVRGRKVVVVDTPGWDWFNLSGTLASPIAVKKEMVASMSLCRPGAHALLLVVPLSFSFSGRERQVAEEHVNLFGPKSWKHTLVVFTVMDTKCLRDIGLQDEVETNSELQMLVEKCGGRYHALHGRPRRGEDPVAELLSKIQDMVSANGGSVLCSDEVLERARYREEQERIEEEERMKREENENILRGSLKRKKLEKRGSSRTYGGMERRYQNIEVDRRRLNSTELQGSKTSKVISRFRNEFSHVCKMQ